MDHLSCFNQDCEITRVHQTFIYLLFGDRLCEFDGSLKYSNSIYINYYILYNKQKKVLLLISKNILKDWLLIIISFEYLDLFRFCRFCRWEVHARRRAWPYF